MDAGYKTPAIARRIIEDGKVPVMPYTRPMTKEGFFKKGEYVYDEYYDCYICPENQILNYSTTNREGYREYKSNAEICERCASRHLCTESKNYTKVRFLCKISTIIYCGLLIYHKTCRDVINL